MLPLMGKRNDDEMVTLVARIEPSTMAALQAWADENDRSMAAQTRRVLRDNIPAKHFQPKEQE